MVHVLIAYFERFVGKRLFHKTKIRIGTIPKFQYRTGNELAHFTVLASTIGKIAFDASEGERVYVETEKKEGYEKIFLIFKQRRRYILKERDLCLLIMQAYYFLFEDADMELASKNMDARMDEKRRRWNR